jgi:hypothetical protein
LVCSGIYMYVYSAWNRSATARQAGKRAAAQETQHGASGFTEKFESLPGIRSLPSPIAGFLSAFRVDSARNYSGEVRAGIERRS